MDRISDRQPARLAALRRTLGAALARRGPLCGVHGQQRQRAVSARVSLSRLGDRLVQRGQAVRPVHPRAACRRPASRRPTTRSATSNSPPRASWSWASRTWPSATRNASAWPWPTSRSTRPAARFLGLTIACAKCHDHKFDPIPTADYYALAGIFRSSEPMMGVRRDPRVDPFATGMIPLAGEPCDFTDEDQRTDAQACGPATSAERPGRAQREISDPARARTAAEPIHQGVCPARRSAVRAKSSKQAMDESEAKLAALRERFIAARAAIRSWACARRNRPTARSTSAARIRNSATKCRAAFRAC